MDRGKNRKKNRGMQARVQKDRDTQRFQHKCDVYAVRVDPGIRVGIEPASKDGDPSYHNDVTESKIAMVCKQRTRRIAIPSTARHKHSVHAAKLTQT